MNILIKKLFVTALVFCSASNAISESVVFVQTDLLGSPVLETDEGGNVLHRSYYKPYGETRGGQRVGVGYTGHLEDEDLGLTYMQARYYDPDIGRFYSNDPVEFNSVNNFNRYSYANNNPYKYIDPDGQDPYLVSRPLTFTSLANHNFIVYNATSIGDPNAIVRSFGNTGNGAMGEVYAETKGFSAGTYQSDTDAWISLSSEGSGTTFRKISAADEKVAKITDSLQGGQKYSLLPEMLGGVNSNTAAGAIANKADGGFPYVDNSKSQPGSTVPERARFKEVEGR
ncbi:RHS repeat-associated core domain-containing protein [Dasania marina]|uniref:RHS repeat-associated core domain-containing protein n=1 Tax=Dasania marina TaxID=471499 RepID=UPI0030D97027|tara:strand:+ start:6194 stop:7045 length:852 start_codon:yes stop_codon:yes gene_type:complete